MKLQIKRSNTDSGFPVPNWLSLCGLLHWIIGTIHFVWVRSDLLSSILLECTIPISTNLERNRWVWMLRGLRPHLQSFSKPFQMAFALIFHLSSCASIDTIAEIAVAADTVLSHWRWFHVGSRSHGKYSKVQIRQNERGEDERLAVSPGRLFLPCKSICAHQEQQGCPIWCLGILRVGVLEQAIRTTNTEFCRLSHRCSSKLFPMMSISSVIVAA